MRCNTAQAIQVVPMNPKRNLPTGISEEQYCLRWTFHVSSSANQFLLNVLCFPVWNSPVNVAVNYSKAIKTTVFSRLQLFHGTISLLHAFIIRCKDYIWPWYKELRVCIFNFLYFSYIFHLVIWKADTYKSWMTQHEKWIKFCNT